MGGLSLGLLRRTSVYSRSGGSAYEWKQFRKVIGTIFLIAAVLFLFIAVVSQFCTANFMVGL